MAKQIKLSGRETGVMRAVGFGLGVSGRELVERTNIAAEDLTDIVNTLLDIGYMETASAKQQVRLEEFLTENFEINPSYANDLKLAMRRA